MTDAELAFHLESLARKMEETLLRRPDPKHEANVQREADRLHSDARKLGLRSE